MLHTLRSPATTAVTLLMLVTFSACATVKLQPPRVYLEGVTPLEIDGLLASTRLKLRIFNPNAIPLPLSTMDYTVKVNNRRLLDGSASDLPTIGPSREESVEITLNINFLSAPSFLIELSKSPTLHYDFSSTVNLKGALPSFDIQETGEFSAD